MEIKISNSKKVGLILILVIVILQLSLLVKLKHLPNPPYGGDFYRERGFIQYIANGNSYWTDPYFRGELEFYPPLGYLIPAFFTKLGVNVEHTLIYLTFIAMFLSAFVIYLIGKKMFESEIYAVIAGLSYFVFEFISIKFSGVLGFLFFALSFYYFIIHRDAPTLKNKILLGLFIGLTALSHYKSFIYTVVIIVSLVIVESIIRYKNNKNSSTIKSIINDYFLPTIISIVLSMLFLLPLILRYSLKTLNETNKYSFAAPNGISTIFRMVFGTFVNYSNFKTIVVSIFLILGIILLCTNLKNKNLRLVFVSFIAVVVASAHYLITKPLFNSWIVPGHIYSGILVSQIFIFVLGIKFVHIYLKKYAKEFETYIPLIVLVLLICPIIFMNYTDYKKSKTYNYGITMDEGTKVLYDIGDWIISNTDNNDVFIGNDESLFMINAMSGRHLTTVRRTHASPYVNVEERYADTLVMLYGTNEETRKKLIEKYNVTYLYADQYLVSYPIIVKSDYADYLKENGINFTIQNMPFDPASADGLKYESAVVLPQELNILNYSIIVKDFYIKDGLYASIFKVGI